MTCPLVRPIDCDGDALFVRADRVTGIVAARDDARPDGVQPRSIVYVVAPHVSPAAAQLWHTTGWVVRGTPDAVAAALWPPVEAPRA